MKLINYRELSRILAGNDESIRANHIPKIYRDKVNELKKLIRQWISEL